MLASCTRCDAVASSIAPWRLVAQPPVTGWFDNIGSGTPYAVLYAATQPPWTIAHGQSIAKTRAIWQCAHTPAPCRPFQHPPVLACVRAQDDIKLVSCRKLHSFLGKSIENAATELHFLTPICYQIVCLWLKTHLFQQLWVSCTVVPSALLWLYTEFGADYKCLDSTHSTHVDSTVTPLQLADQKDNEERRTYIPSPWTRVTWRPWM